MDGESCLEELLELNPGAKVIVATGAILSADREASLLARARGIVMKPFQGDALLQTIRRVLDAD
jgi:DNA-binding NarL/FixJ family response regulator